jgi:hypothetical protein
LTSSFQVKKQDRWQSHKEHHCSENDDFESLASNFEMKVNTKRSSDSSPKVPVRSLTSIAATLASNAGVDNNTSR